MKLISFKHFILTPMLEPSKNKGFNCNYDAIPSRPNLVLKEHEIEVIPTRDGL
jgi:hypothetical protein